MAVTPRKARKAMVKYLKNLCRQCELDIDAKLKQGEYRFTIPRSVAEELTARYRAAGWRVTVGPAVDAKHASFDLAEYSLL